MVPRFFIAQAAIDSWVSADQVELQGDTLVVRGVGAQLRLTPAALFMKVAGGGPDAQGLVGRVKDHEALAAMGGEAYMSSVVLGDTAYDVEPGFAATSLDEDGQWSVLTAALHALASS